MTVRWIHNPENERKRQRAQEEARRVEAERQHGGEAHRGDDRTALAAEVEQWQQRAMDAEARIEGLESDVATMNQRAASHAQRAGAAEASLRASVKELNAARDEVASLK